MRVYHIGYNAPLASERLKKIMSDSNVDLIDTRFTPRTWVYGFSEIELANQYHDRYKSAGKVLGNKLHKHKSGLIDIVDLPRGVRRCVQLLQQGRDLCLLCCCANAATCHRKLILDAINQALSEVQIVDPETIPVEQADIVKPNFKALSIRQPYANWILHPEWFEAIGLPPKTVENREWNPRYRGPILIHAGATFEYDALMYWDRAFGSTLHKAVPQRAGDYARGCLVGIADLVDVIDCDRDDPWFVGTYGFKLANVRAFEQPIRFPGKLNFFPVPYGVVEQAMQLQEV